MPVPERSLTKHPDILRRYGKTVTLREDEHRPADHPAGGLMVVLSGELRTYAMTEDGREVTLSFSAAGDLLVPHTSTPGTTAGAIAGGPPIARFHQAVIPSEVLVMDESAIRRLTAEDASAGAALTLAALSTARDAITNLQDMMLHDAEARVASLLLRLEAVGAAAGDEGIPKRITQEQMAGMVGVARETVSRVLSTLRKLGIISHSGRRIVIDDHKRLRGLSV